MTLATVATRRGPPPRSHREVGSSDEPAFFLRDVVKVDALVDQHDVPGPDLGDQVRGGGREEPLMEVVPDCFQVRVHAREW